MPACGIILIGAGTGTGPWVQYLRERNYPTVMLVEADGDLFQLLQRVTSQHTQWQLNQQLVAPDNGPVIFHQASLSSENGLLQPELLRSLWSNLKTRSQQTLQPISLKRLIHDGQSPVNWLLVDCLPALPIIESAGPALDSINVIMARVILDESSLCDRTTHLVSLQAALNDDHFRLLTIEPSRNHAVGYALFARNPESIIQTIHSHLTDSARELAAVKKELAELKLRTGFQDNEVRIAESQIALLKEILLQDGIT
jgi:hypothetical protein